MRPCILYAVVLSCLSVWYFMNTWIHQSIEHQSVWLLNNLWAKKNCKVLHCKALLIMQCEQQKMTANVMQWKNPQPLPFWIVYIRMLCTLTKESRATLACLYRTSGRFYMLQLISADSRHFTQPPMPQHQVRMWACCNTTGYSKESWALIGWKYPPFLSPLELAFRAKWALTL